MLLHFARFVLGIEDRQLGEHAHMGALQSQSSLQQVDQLFEITTILEEIRGRLV